MALFTGHTITPDSALGGIQLERSLRFDDNQSSPTRLTRTIQSGGNRKKFTLSVWVKRGQLGTTSYSNSAGNAGQSILHTVGQGNRGWIRFNSDDTLGFDQGSPAGVGGGIIDTVAVYRDVTSWYHLVFVADYANSTAADRAKIYVNGVQQEVSTTRSFLYDTDGEINANDIHEIGFSEYGQGVTGSSWWFEFFCGYMAEYHFVDGQSYDPTYFGYTDAHTGQWRPKKYEGTHGTTGWYLPFTDNSSTSALGKDIANGNNWTVNGFSVSAGINNDSMLDVPTNNWCVWNGLTDVSDITLNDGALQAVSGTDSWPAIFGTHGVSSGKWYYEAVGADNTRWGVGWSTEEFKSGTSNTFSVGHFAYSQDPLTFYQDGTNSAINGTPAFTTGNVLQIAIDIDNGKTWFGINNTWVNASNGSAGDPAAGTNPTITFSEKGQKHYPKLINNLGDVSVNFGQQGFTYTPPDGFQALNSKNLATVRPSGVVRPQRHFDTLLYTGNNNTSQNITGLEFQPDLVWVKNRDNVERNHLVDSVRGNNKVLNSDHSDGERTGSHGNGHTQLNLATNGFNLVSNGSNDELNFGTRTYVAWCWKAGGAAVSNTDGDITSSVSVNEEAGFSIATYTGSTASGALTVGHGLGKKPAWVMIKRRDSSGEWIIGHQGLATNAFQNNKFLKFSTNGTFTNSLVFGAEPTTTVTQIVTDGNAGASNLTSSGTYVMYSWAEIPGYSKFGSYTGNGSTDGTYVHLGFKPAYLMIKNQNNGFNWVIQDYKRSPTNLCDNKLNPDSTAVEQTDYDKLDMLSNGFKPRVSDAGINASSSSYVYMAFAERPTGTIFGLDANAR